MCSFSAQRENTDRCFLIWQTELWTECKLKAGTFLSGTLVALKELRRDLECGHARKQSEDLSIFMKHFWRCEGVEIYSSLLEVNIMALWGFAKPQPLMTPAKSVKAEQPLRSPQKLTKHRENLLSGAINFFLDTSFALYSCSNRFSLKTSYLVWELMKCRVGCVVCSQCESRK